MKKKITPRTARRRQAIALHDYKDMTTGGRGPLPRMTSEQLIEYASVSPVVRQRIERDAINRLNKALRHCHEKPQHKEA
jgi:hypothetical protein